MKCHLNKFNQERFFKVDHKLKLTTLQISYNDINIMCDEDFIIIQANNNNNNNNISSTLLLS